MKTVGKTGKSKDSGCCSIFWFIDSETCVAPTSFLDFGAIVLLQKWPVAPAVGVAENYNTAWSLKKRQIKVPDTMP